jgi:hypothetical protein
MKRFLANYIDLEGFILPSFDKQKPLNLDSTLTTYEIDIREAIATFFIGVMVELKVEPSL